MRRGTKKILENITIEPMIILFNFSDALDMLSLDQLKIEKACIQKFNYSQDVCINLVDYEEENVEVQNYVSFFAKKEWKSFSFFSNIWKSQGGTI